MEPRFLILADADASPLLLAKFRELSLSVANAIGEPVALASQPAAGVARLQREAACEGTLEVIEPASAAPMTAAPFVYGPDGRPDWAAMWSTFCELALYGGPPHRGEENPLEVAEADGETSADEMIWEMRRGIAETTGLYCKFYPPSWLAVMCESSRMAAWLCAAIILENVEAWCEGSVLFVPAGPGFRLQDEVKSVITVVAKTHHYWQQHVASRGAREDLLVAWDAHFH